MSFGAFRIVPVPRWAKMSPILPTEIDRPPGLGQPVEQRRLRRRHGVVAPVGVRLNVSGVSPTNGRAMTRPTFSGSQQPARDLAHLVEPLQPEMGLVRGDLEHRVGRGVADRLAGPDVLLAERLDDRHARGVLVAEDARQLRLGDQRVGQRLRERRLGVRKIGPRERHRHAGDLPVAGWRVLAGRGLDAVAEDRSAVGRPLQPRRQRAGRGLRRLPEAEPRRGWGASAVPRASPSGRRGRRRRPPRYGRAYRRPRRRTRRRPRRRRSRPNPSPGGTRVSWLGRPRRNAAAIQWGQRRRMWPASIGAGGGQGLNLSRKRRAKGKSAMEGVTVVDHPLVQHKLTLMRDKTTSTASFRQLAARDRAAPHLRGHPRPAS